MEVANQINKHGAKYSIVSDMCNCVILGGRSHPDLVRRICQILDVEPAPLEAKNFSNGETSIAIKETVRDKDVFVIQTSCGAVNDQLMELLIVISALKMASAKSVTAVLPLFPYSRQPNASSVLKYSQTQPSNLPNIQEQSSIIADFASPRKASTFGEEVRNNTPPPRKLSEDIYGDKVQSKLRFVLPTSRAQSYNTNSFGPGGSGGPGGGSNQPLGASLINPEYNAGERSWIAQNGSIIASLLATAGADHVITMDLHDPQFQGFFDVPFDNLLFRPLLTEYIKTMLPTYHSAVIVSPDAGGAKRATTVADQLHTRIALIHQDRRNSATILVGDVKDRIAVLIDDLIDTGNTLIRAAKILKDHGACMVYAICTHGVFSGDTVQRVKESAIDFLVTTNSVPQDRNQEVLGDRLHVVDISVLFAETIRRVFNGESISRLYSHAPGAL